MRKLEELWSTLEATSNKQHSLAKRKNNTEKGKEKENQAEEKRCLGRLKHLPE